MKYNRQFKTWAKIDHYKYYNKKDNISTAYHEIGHFFMGSVRNNIKCVSVNINKKDGIYSHCPTKNKQEMIEMLLGGVLAEELFIKNRNKINWNLEDIEKCKKFYKSTGQVRIIKNKIRDVLFYYQDVIEVLVEYLFKNKTSSETDLFNLICKTYTTEFSSIVTNKYIKYKGNIL